MVLGVGIAVLAVLCHVFKLAISVWFNHMDLSHIIIALSVYTMYKGVALYQKNFQRTSTINF
jgi:NADH:ubiquinone oxidoreductase subunit 2 (subunit N)